MRSNFDFQLAACHLSFWKWTYVSRNQNLSSKLLQKSTMAKTSISVALATPYQNWKSFRFRSLFTSRCYSYTYSHHVMNLELVTKIWNYIENDPEKLEQMVMESLEIRTHWFDGKICINIHSIHLAMTIMEVESYAVQIICAEQGCFKNTKF